MSCQGWAPLGVGFCSRAQEKKFPSREMPSYDLQQATTGAKGEVTVIGKCGFVGFAELRVSVLRNVYFAGRRLQRLPCPSAGVPAAAGRWVQPASPACSSSRRAQSQETSRTVRCPAAAPVHPAAEYLRFTPGLPQAYRERQDLSCK